MVIWLLMHEAVLYGDLSKITNPILFLTNRNKAPYIIQGIGHGDLIRDTNGDWHILCLGFRQIHIWHTFHHLGREVFLNSCEL